MSALASIAVFPELIYNKFITKKYTPQGYYEILFFLDGEWQIVFVDDYFPCIKDTIKIAFSRQNDAELWVMLLEKAWAKVNGGYSNIILGLVGEALLAITGFSSQYYDISSLKEADLWNMISTSDSLDCIMCTATKNESYLENFGLIPGHAYT